MPESMRFYYITGTFVIIGLIAITWFCLFRERPAPMISEEMVREHGPYISDFLGLSFPGQYAPMSGYAPISNTRTTSYALTEEDRERAVKKIQDTFQNTQKVSVVFDNYGGKKTDICGKEFLLSYDQHLAAKLGEQANLMGDTSISPFSAISAGSPYIVFSLHPSGVTFEFYSRDICHVKLITCHPRWQNAQRWYGNFHYSAMALLDARLQDGETVRSKALHFLDDSHWLLKEQTPENSESKDQTDSEWAVNLPRKEVAQLKQEVEILQKATAYFAKEVM